MNQETSFALLGALVALLVVLVVFAIFVGTIAKRAIGYAARFKGFQAGRNANHEMTFSAKIDESPLDEDGYPELPLEPENEGADPEALN